jgi:hypothetical protein
MSTRSSTFLVWPGPVASVVRPVLCVALAAGMAPRALVAQTDYYNTDAGRPVLIEDAYPTERYAFELQLAPLRLERQRGGVYNWSVEPEIAYGILPRTQVEVGLPVSFVDAGGSAQEFGLAGIDLSVLHNLNVETSIPALAVAADVVLPVGRFAPDRIYPSVKGIATRTYSFMRVHVNGRWTFGEEPPLGLGERVGAELGSGAEELSRWIAGVAVDKTFPLRSMLVIADLYAQQAIQVAADVEWNAGAGVRYQLNPYFAVDGGIGKRLTGDDPSWFVTFGLARAFAVRSLIPVPLR